MGRFDPWTQVQCQNDEVSTVCTPTGRVREGVDHTPADPADKLLLGSAPHGLSAVFSTTPVLVVLQEIMTETGI